MIETAPPAPRARSGTGALISLGVLVFLEVILFVSGLAMGAEGEDVLVLLLALVTFSLAAGPILLDMTRPAAKRQILITLLVLVYVVLLVVPVFTQYFLLKGEYTPGTFRLNQMRPAEIAHAQMVALLGLAALLIGFYLPTGRVLGSALPKPTREWPPHAALFVALFTLALGWLVYGVGQLGIIPQRAGSGALGTVASGSYFGISLLTLTWLRHRRREALLLITIVIPLSMLFNFFTGSKTLFLTPPFMFALAYIVYERRIRMSWVAAGFVTLIVLYPMSQFYRDVIQTDKTRGGIQSFLRNPAGALEALVYFGENVELGGYIYKGIRATGSRLDALGVLTVIVRDTPERVPYQGGWTIGYIAISYVPRILWPEKPKTTIGEWVSQSYGDPFDLTTDVGPSWIGELFLNWGYTGVVLGMFVMGLLCRILHESFFGWNAPIPAMFAAVIALYAVVRTVQSALVSPINGTVYDLVPLMIAHYAVGMFTGFYSGSSVGPGSNSGSYPSGAPAAPTH